MPGTPLVLGLFDNGRSAADTLFDVLVPISGSYPFQLIYFESQGSASREFFSVTNLATGDKVLINDLASADAIRSYRQLAPPITGIVPNGPNAVIQWAYGTSSFQVQFKAKLTDAAWSNVGAPTTDRTASVPMQSGAGFIRVFGQ